MLWDQSSTEAILGSAESYEDGGVWLKHPQQSLKTPRQSNERKVGIQRYSKNLAALGFTWRKFYPRREESEFDEQYRKRTIGLEKKFNILHG